MIFLLSYWKQLAIIGAIVIILPVTFYKGYESGKAHVQAEWNQQSILDAQTVAIADNKTAAQVINAQKVTQNENLNLKQNLDSTHDYYSHHNVAGIDYRVCNPSGKTDSSEMPSVPNSTNQPNDNTTDTVSRTDFEKLANDCLATTLQLDNAQEWAMEQVKLNVE
jgi:hypothetical protein